MNRVKEVYTTGEVAAYCGVNFRTVSRWIEKGHLKGFQLPGRGDRRVRRDDLIHFMRANQMAIPSELSGVESESLADVCLVVDNEEGVANAIHRVLHRGKIKCQVALDGFHAGFYLRKLRPAVMTLDLNMPGMHGFEVLQTIKELPIEDRPAVLVVSGEGSKLLTEALERGADAALAKPFRNEELLYQVQELLKVKQN